MFKENPKREELARTIHEAVHIHPRDLESRQSGGIETNTGGRGRPWRCIIHEGTPFVKNAG